MPLLPAMRPALWLAFLLVPPAALAQTQAQPAPLRPQDTALLAGTCANCHGPAGRSTGAIPGLRGQPAEYLLQRMLAFKAGQAADATVMTRLMKGYDEAQIRALAQWFSSEETAP